MTLAIEKIEKASSALWDEIWNHSDCATFYHSRYWAEIWQKYLDGKFTPSAQLLTFTDGKKVILPFSKHKVLGNLIVRHLSSPATTYGGWITRDSLEIEHQELLNEYLSHKVSNLILRVNPYDKQASILNQQANISEVTQVLDLKLGFEQVLGNISKKYSTFIKKAENNGITIRLANDEDDWKIYYDVYRDSLKRWGDSASSVYKWSFFKELSNLSTSNVKLWLAEINGQIISGIVCFYAKNHVVYHHGSTLQEALKDHPVQLIFREAIKDACDQSIQWFDFNPSGGHKGVHEFKRRFGAVELQANVINHQHRCLTFFEKIYKAWLLKKR